MFYFALCFQCLINHQWFKQGSHKKPVETDTTWLYLYSFTRNFTHPIQTLFWCTVLTLMPMISGRLKTAWRLRFHFSLTFSYLIHWMQESISKSLSLTHHSLTANPGKSISMQLVTESDILYTVVSSNAFCWNGVISKI